MSNQGYLWYTKLSPNARKVFKHIRRMHGKNLCVHGEDAKGLLAYSHNMQRDIKVRISQLTILRGKIVAPPIMVQSKIFFLKSYYLCITSIEIVQNSKSLKPLSGVKGRYESYPL